MAIEITNITASRLRQQAQQAERAQEQQSDDARNRRADAAGSGADKVEISPDAKAIERLEARVAESDSFDQRRVDEITRAISEGRYPIDQDRIAEKFLELEDQLSR